jgi:hypothetical protein
MTRSILIVAILFVLTPMISYAQLLSEGHYIGYEQIHVRKATEGSLVFYPGMYIRDIENSIDKSWFHQVTITIHNDSVTIARTPIVIKDNQIVYSDSIGGFYHYKGIVVQLEDSSIVIRAYLDSTKHVPYHGTGTPFYVRNGYSKIKVDGNNLILQAGYLGRLTFRKVE